MKSEDAGDVSPKAGNYLSGETAMLLNHICGNIFFYIHCTILRITAVEKRGWVSFIDYLLATALQAK